MIENIESKAPSRNLLPKNIAIVFGVCVVFFIFPILILAAGLFLLWKNKAISSGIKLGMTSLVVLPHPLYWWFHQPLLQDGLVFRFESATFAASSNAWMYYALLWCVVLYIVMLSVKGGREWLATQGIWFKHGSDIQWFRKDGSALKIRDKAIIAGFAFLFVGAFVAVETVKFFGLDDDFHTVRQGNDGVWGIWHDIRGRRAAFAVDEIDVLQANEWWSRSTRVSASGAKVLVRLTDGRSFAMSTDSSFVFDELRTLAMTMDIDPDKVSLIRRNGQKDTYNPAGFRLKDIAGTYVASPGADMRSGNVLELEMHGNMLAGKEVITLEGRQYPRKLEQFRVKDTGEFSARAANILDVRHEPSDQTQIYLKAEPEIWGKFRDGGIEIGGSFYVRQK